MNAMRCHKYYLIISREDILVRIIKNIYKILIEGEKIDKVY